MPLFALKPTPRLPGNSRREIIDQQLARWESLKQAKAQTATAVDAQAAKIRKLDDPKLPLDIDEAAYQVEHVELRQLRREATDAVKALERFEQESNVPGLVTERAAITAAEDAEAQREMRDRLVEMLVDFDAVILRPAVERQKAIEDLFIQIERRWPNMRTTLGLPVLPRGFILPDGKRHSIPRWFRQALHITAGLYPDDPDAQVPRDSTGAPIIYGPGSPEWS